jgi:hypothetical protein
MNRGRTSFAGIFALSSIMTLAGCGLATSGLFADVPLAANTADAGSSGLKPDASAPALDASGGSPFDAGSIDANDASTADGGGGGDDDDGGDADACSGTTDVTSLGSIAESDAPPVIDGDLRDWPCSGWLTITPSNAGFVRTGGDPLAAEIATRWDQGNLYVAVHVIDPSVAGNNATDLYTNDSVELYLTGDPAPTGDYDSVSHQYVTDWTGRIVDYGPSHDNKPGDRQPAHFTAATRPMPDGWALEAQIGAPAVVAGAFVSGANIGFDVEINDGDGTNQRGSLIAALSPVPAACTCKQQQCCCGHPVDLPYCDSARIARSTLH